MTIFITGTSSGIGQALALYYLERGDTVAGVSRRSPADLKQYGHYYHLSQDLTDFHNTYYKIETLVKGTSSFDLVILNAGILPSISDMREADIDEMKKVMDINLWSNKVVLDALFDKVPVIKQVVAISSGAAVSGNRGWNAYSISKAALNMMISLYANECKGTHFSALAPGIIDTDMQEYIASLPKDERFSAMSWLKSIRGTSEMPSPEKAAPLLAETMEKLLKKESGGFYDVRKM